MRDMIKTIILLEVSSASSCESAYAWIMWIMGGDQGGGGVEVRDLTWLTRTLPHSLLRLTLVRTGWLIELVSPQIEYVCSAINGELSLAKWLVLLSKGLRLDWLSKQPLETKWLSKWPKSSCSRMYLFPVLFFIKKNVVSLNDIWQLLEKGSGHYTN